MCTILAIGQDADLLSTRSAVLRRCYARVVAAHVSEARKLLKAERFDLVVLCHTVSSQEMNELVLLARRQASDSQVLEILKATEIEGGRVPSDADDVAASRPETMIAKVREMLRVPVRIH
jgi:DNA-binding NtrC family response regulator